MKHFYVSQYSLRLSLPNVSGVCPQDILPYMAQEYGFEYELVQYQWPRWLQRQRDRQRTIWGYKILFLDVLFPLHVKKIIFVDADQVRIQFISELLFSYEIGNV